MIKTIVFDIGNVLFHYDPAYILNQLLPDSPYHQQYLDHFFNAQVWQDLDKGIIAESKLAKQLAPLIPDPDLKKHIPLLIQNFIHHLHLNNEARQLFLRLKHTYPIYLLSNFQAVPFANLRELHPFLYQADGTVISAHHKLMKPDPKIYDYLLTHYFLKPDQTVFIDDLPDNISAAKQAGIHGIVFESTDQLITDLKTLQVIVEPAPISQEL
jgi:putative hydrolase of the HAD superfamily